MAERDPMAAVRAYVQLLRHPFRLRLAVCGVALALACFGIHAPLDGRIRVAAARSNAPHWLTTCNSCQRRRP
jgi:hypothetical protein